MWKKILKKISWSEKKKSYPNRFVKFYHLHQARLKKERRGFYAERKEKGVCVRCRQKAVKGIVFCAYHQQKQVEYNRKARRKD